MAKLVHVAVVPSPGMGHFVSLVEFARRLVVAHPNFLVTLIVPTIGQPTQPVKSILESLPIAVQHVYLPPVMFGVDPPPPGVQISVAMSRSVEPLREVLSSLSEGNYFSAIVFDLLSVELLDSVKEFKIPVYVFSSSSALMLSFCLFLPELDRVVSGEYRDLPDPVEVPGGRLPIHGRDFPDAVQDRESEYYRSVLKLARQVALVDGIMVDSFAEMEEGVVRALGKREGVPPVYPVGPLIYDGSGERVDGSECFKWLDNQPRGSVLFISFGSGGTLSRVQTNELANGLEQSGQKFLWVVRTPNDTSAHGAYFGESIGNDPLEFLPKGFLERIKGRGLVVPNWAPQAQVLTRASIGGFLTHCGWNSSLEGIVNGQPLIVWPLHSEQKINAILLSEHLNVGLRPKVNDNDIVPREEVAKIVKALMEDEEGELIRKNMKLLQNEAKKALSEEGDSTKALADLALQWGNHTST